MNDMKMIKKLITMVVVVAMVAVSALSGLTLSTVDVHAASKFKIKGYRHSHAALIEWSKVPGATNYKIYRATKKKGKKNKYYGYKELKIKKGENKLTEKWFTKYGDNALQTRWFINVDTNGFEKTQKKYLYNHKKIYKYYVKALKGKKEIARSKIYTTKKFTFSKYQPRYDNLYYVNRERYKRKLSVIPWGHQYNKGLKGRAKDIKIRVKRRDNFNAKNKHGIWLYHTRPKGTIDDLYKYLLNIDLVTLSISNATQSNENIAKNVDYAKDIIDGYMHSPGHKKVIVKNILILHFTVPIYTLSTLVILAMM